ncbi:hypothetical protein D0B54_16885 [Solimonas sp. K1W22B-7]|uniref:hypothetical protein n=1 Tax=Solimonas sp. K1W22B-7 TaxID=2303331 RepID=UPI000E32E9A4|nr:hypothetical protein [Solimonas sp. K1W22B-7]AXQ30245.1 hypothetical protein D0B54_16885 [Solimonas sp. K1W22B-7]
MLLATLTALAIVAQDDTALRAAARDSAQQQAQLWQGDTLEVRGERLGFLQVWDHERERGGYVRATQLRLLEADEAHAPELLAVLRFLRDTPGQESLGIAYAAAYLKAAPAAKIDAEPFDALGVMGERLARRGSGKQAKADEVRTAGHLDTARHYGLTFTQFERDDGRVQLCYEGDAFRRVLSLLATPAQRARAALALTRHDCVDPATRPLERVQFDQWRAELLDRVDLASQDGTTATRIRLRRAGVWSALAYAHARRADGTVAAAAAETRALEALAGVDRAQLPEDEQRAYTEAAVRVGASRWAMEPAAVPAASAKLAVTTAAGEPGETCVLLTGPKNDAKNPLLRRCTYGRVWNASARANAGGTALALSVQPLDTWLELWVFTQTDGAWSVQVLPPAAAAPGIGYVEFAGWVPGGKQILAAREARIDGRWLRSYELVSLATLLTERAASEPAHLTPFYRWQSADWKQRTVSLRQ